MPLRHCHSPLTADSCACAPHWRVREFFVAGHLQIQFLFGDDAVDFEGGQHRHELVKADDQRSNRAYAANRPEETRGECVVARWKAVLRKTGMAMVHFARGLAWSWVTSSTLVSRPGGSQPPGRHPVRESEQDDVPDATPPSITDDGVSHGPTQSQQLSQPGAIPNCPDDHPIMSRMHKPDPTLPANQQDKRSVVSIEPVFADRWLRGDLCDVEALIRPPAIDVLAGAPIIGVPNSDSASLF